MQPDIPNAIDAVTDLLGAGLSHEHVEHGRTQVLRMRLANGSRDALAARVPDREPAVRFSVDPEAGPPRQITPELIDVSTFELDPRD